MHPTLARYLHPAVTRALLARIDEGEDVGPEHRHLAAVAARWPDERREILSAPEHVPPRAQSAVLFLATHAALKAAREGPPLAADLEAASSALQRAGAEADEADALFAQLFAEEAFDADADPESFDADWVREGLRDLPALVALDASRVEALLTEFCDRAPTRVLRKEHERAARALLEAAWAEGVAPITAEHLDEALAALPEAARAIQLFVEFLHEKGLVGRLRAERLAGRAGFAALAPDE